MSWKIIREQLPENLPCKAVSKDSRCKPLIYIFKAIVIGEKSALEFDFLNDFGSGFS